MIGVYMVATPNNELYIGQSKNVERRLRSHMVHSSNTRLRESIRKYGEENHIFELIEECDEAELLEKEAYHIKEYSKTHVVLNLLPRLKYKIKPKKETSVKMRSLSVKVHDDIRQKVIYYIEKENQKELKKESKLKTKQDEI